MGLGAVNRKGWQTNPRKQGRWNFYTSIIAVVFGTLLMLIIEGVEGISYSYLIGISIFLLWGVVSLFLGVLIGRLQDKANKQNK